MFCRSPSLSPTTTPSRTPTKLTDSMGYSPMQDSEQNRLGGNVDVIATNSSVSATSFLPPPPNQFKARNYSDIMRSLAAKYNSCER